MIGNIKLEICAGSLSDVIAVSDIPEVDRIELNCSLESGGLTPSLNTFLLAKKYTNKKIICMVRPRQAGFIYHSYEKEVMLKDAETFLKNGADGIVFGSLNSDLTIDSVFTKEIVDCIHAYHGEAVFHKAFDEVKDTDQAIQTLINLKVDRILTSGGAQSTLDGIPMIEKLIQQYGNQIEILPGGGVQKDNVLTILQKTNASQIHMTAKSTYHDISSYFAVDPVKVRDIIKVLQKEYPQKQRTYTREDQEMLNSDRYEDIMLPYPDNDYEN